MGDTVSPKDSEEEMDELDFEPSRDTILKKNIKKEIKSEKGETKLIININLDELISTIKKLTKRKSRKREPETDDDYEEPAKKKTKKKKKKKKRGTFKPKKKKKKKKKSSRKPKVAKEEYSIDSLF